MRKILFITHQLSRTGAPIVLMDMMKVCLKYGCHIEVISMMDGELRTEFEDMGINITIRDNFVDNWEEFRKFAEGFETVVANTLITYQVIHVLNGANVPVIWWLHEGEQYFEYFKTVIPDMSKLKRNIHIYSVGQYVQEVVRRRYGIETDILHMGVSDNYKSADKNRCDDVTDKVTFLVAGTYSSLKGQDILAQAVRLLDEDTRSGLRLIFCGNEEMYDESVYSSVCRLCDDYQNVIKLGSVKHDVLLKLMNDTDYLVVPSRVDPIPTVAAEAMMMHKPCVITDVCGAAYYMTDGKDSLKIAAENVEELKDALGRALKLRTEEDGRYLEMCDAARDIYEEHFSEDIFEQKVKKILNLGSGQEMSIDKGRVIFMTGLYDILDIFTYELIDEFNNMGYETFEFDTSNMQMSLGKMYDFIKKTVKAVITFNNLGYNMELVEGKNVWEQLGIPCINILMDHPFCHKKALDDSPSNAIVLCVDRNHMKYLQRFYPQIPIVGFLPHGGKNKFTEHKKIADRSIDVIYAGGISRGFAYDMMPDFTKFSFDARAVADAAYDAMIINPHKTTEEAIEEELIKRDIHLEDSELCDVIEKLHYVDLLIVSYYREKVVKILVDAGIKVTLYGTGWEVCDWIDNPNLDYRGRVSAEEIVDRMQDSKIVLSTMTWFKDGTHDRVFNGMLAKAVAITDSSGYMKEEFCYEKSEDGRDERELVMFELDAIDKLPLTVRQLLSDYDNMQEIAERGYKKAVAGHTWQARAHELDRDLISML